MKKKNIIIIILAILLLAFAGYLFFTNHKSTIAESVKDFAIRDTSSITKIVMSDMSGKLVTIDRSKDRVWMVNNHFKARKDAIDILLETMMKLTVKTPVGTKAFENVVKHLSSGSVKVEIYQDDELVKSYYVGGPTQDQLGTYMLLEDPKTKEKAKNPFIMYIPGFNGYLTTRYFVSEPLWRDRTVVNLTANEIKSVRVIYPKDKQNSYLIENKGKTVFLKDTTGKPISAVDTNLTRKYLSYFENINYEAVAEELSSQVIDSILKSTPMQVLEIVDNKNVKTLIKTYVKNSHKGEKDLTGKIITIDADRQYIQLNNQKSLAIAQYYFFDKVFRPIAYFIKK